eukprot:scaffold244601_cov27-Tisochrysis_lutea.AAC.1
MAVAVTESWSDRQATRSVSAQRSTRAGFAESRQAARSEQRPPPHAQASRPSATSAPPPAPLGGAMSVT